MPASEILRICTTVAFIQFLCNVVGNWFVFNNKAYVLALERLERATKAKDQAKGEEAANKKGQKADKRAKRIKRVEDEHKAAVTMVAGMHLVPNILTSVVFFIVLRIFGTDLKGTVIGVLPFTPFSFLRRLTGRGLEFGNAVLLEPSSPRVTDIEQACSFMFVRGPFDLLSLLHCRQECD